MGKIIEVISYLKIKYWKYKLHLQAYGKLPFYRDYVSIIFFREAIVWRNWMLDHLDQNKMISKEPKPFVFVHSIKSKIIAGIIKQSSDGKRQFPFSVFIVCKPKKLELFGLNQILSQLDIRFNSLMSIRNINNCIKFIKNNPLVLKNKKSNKELGCYEPSQLSDPKDYPFFIVLHQEFASDYKIIK